jgi:predicted DNA-binding transcriptional regulator AlpA
MEQNLPDCPTPGMPESGPRPDFAAILMTAPQAAALLGRSLRTWRVWDAAGRIPRAIRIGRSTFWRPEELRAWVDARCPDRRTWEAMQE